MKKHIRFSLYTFVILLVVVWVFKQLGYPLVWYGLNGYYNLQNEYKIQNKQYTLNVPFWDWKIININNKSTTLEGVSEDKTFIHANVRHQVELYNLNSIKKMCMEKEAKIIQNQNYYDIFCSLKNKNIVKKYRIFYIPNKIIIFMNDYNKKYSKTYTKLLSNIEIK